MKNKKKERGKLSTIFFTTIPKWQVGIGYYCWEKSNFSSRFKLELVTI